ARKGEATLKLKLPGNLTRGRATARGLGGESLFGEGSGSLLAKRDILVRLDAPRFLTQGDEAVVPTAIHNGGDSETSVVVKVRAEGATLSGEDATVAVPAGGRKVHDRAVAASVARLKNMANDDGSYGWFRGGKGDAAMTALAVLGLREADRMGVAGSGAALARAASALRGLVRAAPDDVQALCHWALAA